MWKQWKEFCFNNDVVAGIMLVLAALVVIVGVLIP